MITKNTVTCSTRPWWVHVRKRPEQRRTRRRRRWFRIDY